VAQAVTRRRPDTEETPVTNELDAASGYDIRLELDADVSTKREERR